MYVQYVGIGNVLHMHCKKTDGDLHRETKGTTHTFSAFTMHVCYIMSVNAYCLANIKCTRAVVLVFPNSTASSTSK